MHVPTLLAMKLIGAACFLKRHGGQQPPHVARFLERESPLAQTQEKTAVHRLHDIFRIDATPRLLTQLLPSHFQEPPGVAIQQLALKTRLCLDNSCEPIRHASPPYD